jgi:hypothetical protein
MNSSRVTENDEPVSGDDVVREFALSASLPSADGFLRAHPAEHEGPERAWALARAVVDYGCALLQSGNLRSDRRLRDAVLTALLRRLLVTTESTIALLSKGLYEPAMSQTRTILDIELAFSLIHGDQTDAFAKRLAAFHYLTYQEHGQDMLGNRPTRESYGEGRAGQVPELIARTKSYARWLEQPVFDDVRESVRTDRFWHGFDNVAAAFRSVGREHDYLVTYDASTWFIHAVNIDHDFAELSESGALSMKPLVERDPASIQPVLGHVVLRCLESIGLYLRDTGVNFDERTGARVELEGEDGEKIPLDSITGLRMLVLRQFDIRENAFGGEAIHAHDAKNRGTQAGDEPHREVTP